MKNAPFHFNMIYFISLTKLKLDNKIFYTQYDKSDILFQCCFLHSNPYPSLDSPLLLPHSSLHLRFEHGFGDGLRGREVLLLQFVLNLILIFLPDCDGLPLFAEQLFLFELLDLVSLLLVLGFGHFEKTHFFFSQDGIILNIIKFILVGVRFELGIRNFCLV